LIDLTSETLLTLEAAADKLQVSKATLHWWITYGTKGIRLEAAKLGGRWRTSEEAIQRLSDRLTPNLHQGLSVS
jgi:predicted site-specific integrase-resolvase